MHSPFQKYIVTVFYDGLKEGITVCAHCGRAYAIAFLDWDNREDVRIYELSEIEKVIPPIAEFISHARSRGPSVAYSDIEDFQYLDRCLNANRFVKFVLAAIHLDQTIIRGERVGSKENVDWFIRFGLDRDADVFQDEN